MRPLPPTTPPAMNAVGMCAEGRLMHLSGELLAQLGFPGDPALGRHEHRIMHKDDPLPFGIYTSLELLEQALSRPLQVDEF